MIKDLDEIDLVLSYSFMVLRLLQNNVKSNEFLSSFPMSKGVFFLNWYSGGGGVQLRPLIVLLCQTRVIMRMEKLVEWLAGETEVLEENLPQCRFVHHKPHMLPGREPGPPQWEASD
jgi:hypothetical protein